MWCGGTLLPLPACSERVGGEGAFPKFRREAQTRGEARAETSLTASAGVSYDKFLAKLASDHRKPNGLFVITPNMGPAFVEVLPVGKFHGVGPATTAKMNKLGIEAGRDLRAQSMAFFQQHFGKPEAYYYWIARRRRPSGPRQPHPQVGRRQEHVSR